MTASRRRSSRERPRDRRKEAGVDQNELDEAFREGYAALNRGEEPSLDLIDEGFEGVNLPEEALGMPAMSGREGLLTWIRGVRDVWDEFQLVPERISWLKPDVVLVQVLLQGRGKASAVRVSERFYNLWTVRNDRAVRLEVHRTEEEAIRAVGVSSKQSTRREEQ